MIGNLNQKRLHAGCTVVWAAGLWFMLAFATDSLAAPVLVVDTAADTVDGDTLSVAALLGDPGADGSISLREAIFAANNTAGIDTITFAIGSGLATISVGTGGLPWLLDGVVLDATTQPGYAGEPLVQLDGSGATGATAGINIRADSCVVRGFIVHSFPDEGIEMDGTTGFGNYNVIQNNWVGIDSSGTAAPNADYGIMVTVGASNNQIGGSGPNQGNVISGNTNSGVIIRNPGSDNNVIEGNLIGVGPDGVTPVANGVHGIEIIDAAAWNRIGDAIAGAGNTISGNAVNGILMQAASSNIVTGNNISGNQGSGVVVLDP